MSLYDIHDEWRVESLEAAKRKVIEPYKDEKYFEESGKKDAQWLMEYIREGSRVLDVGAGVGRIAKHLADKCRLVAYDPSQAMNRFSFEFYYDDTPRINRLDFVRDGYFDLIYSIITVQHIPIEGVRELFKEVARILKKDGSFIFNIDDHYVRDKDDLNYKDREVIRAFIEEAGLVVDKYDDLGTNHWYFLKKKS